MKMKLAKRLLIISAICMIFVVLTSRKNEATSLIESYISDNKPHEIEPKTFEEKVLKDVGDSEFNIFFVESNHKRENLALKQLCAIESAARHNPTASVVLFAVNAKFNHTVLLETYKNIKSYVINVTEFMMGTPLETFWFSNKLASLKNRNRLAHLSDALRLLSLYKFGGMYLDLDMITLNSFNDLLKYQPAVGIEDSRYPIYIGNSILVGEKNNAFFLECLNDYANKYDPGAWSGMGPIVVTRVLKKYCNKPNLYDWVHKYNKLPETLGENRDVYVANPDDNACGVTVFPYYVAYPYPGRKTHMLFEKNSEFNMTNFLYTKCIHINNGDTGYKMPNKDDKSIVEFIVKHNCPIIYEESSESIIKNVKKETRS